MSQDGSSSPIQRPSRWATKLIGSLIFLGGCTLLGGMVWQVGLTGLLTSVQTLGPWVVPFLLLDSVSLWFHTAGWAACFPKGQLHLRLWQLCLIRLAGSAINWVTPTAAIGGEVAKVFLLEPAMPRVQAAATVVIDKASVTLAQVCYLALGTLCLTKYLPLPAEFRWGLYLSLALVTLGLAGFVVFQRYGLLSKLVRWLSYLRIGRTTLQRLSQRLTPFDTQLVTYYTAHPWRFVWSWLMHSLAFIFDGIQTYILLRLLLGDSAPGLAPSLMVAVAVTALDQMFFFVAGNLGTLEGVRFVVLSTLGMAQAYGLAFGLVARLHNLFWNGLGLLAYGLCTRRPRLLQPSQARVRPSVAVPLIML
jgi:uncharacterized protein (TIRG00374 family)